MAIENAPKSTSDAATSTDIRSLVESIKELTPPRKVRFNEYKTRSPFNPTGNRKRKLDRICFQNGARINVALLFDEEIKLLNTLPEGRFIDQLVTVRKDAGSGGDKDKIHIEYANRTHDQRITFAEHVRSFVGLLRQIHEEAKASGGVKLPPSVG